MQTSVKIYTGSGKVQKWELKGRIMDRQTLWISQ